MPFFLVMLAGYGSVVRIVHMHSCTLYTSIHMLTHTRTHLHTCCCCKWYFLSTSRRVYFPLLPEKDPKFLHLFETAELGANLCWGRRRVSQGVRSTLAFVQAKYSTGVKAFMGRLWSSWLSAQILMVVCCVWSTPFWVYALRWVLQFANHIIRTAYLHKE